MSEIRVDWDKVPQITKILIAVVAFSFIFIILSIIIGIWWDAFPTAKLVLTGTVIFFVSAWIVRADVLDDYAEIKVKYRKKDNELT